MFKFEKDMVAMIEKSGGKAFKANKVTTEYNGGNGIADLVFVQYLENEASGVFDYKHLRVLLKLLKRKGSRLSISDMMSELPTKKSAEGLVKTLIENGYLEECSNCIYKVRKKYHPPAKQIISIEAKLKDWKSGIIQAKRYQYYSNQSYLAISAEFEHRVDVDKLRESGIGLISVSKKGIIVRLRPKRNQHLNDLAYTYLSERSIEFKGTQV